jgi:hypothetical protein
MEANQGKMMAKLDHYHERMMAWLDSQPEKMEAHLEKMESMEEIESKLEHHEVPKEEAAAGTARALKDGYVDRHRRQPKKRPQGNVGSRKKLATACRGMNHHAIPAQRKGHCREGHVKEKAVPGNQKGWTFRTRRWAKPEGVNGIRNQDSRQQLGLENTENVNETFKETLGLEITKRIAESSIRIRKMSVRTLWKDEPHPKCKKKLHTE